MSARRLRHSASTWLPLAILSLSMGALDCKATDAPTSADPAATATVPYPQAQEAPSAEAHAPALRAPLASSRSVAPASALPSAPRPLAEWMRGPVTKAFASGDLESIAATFDEMAKSGPRQYENWASIAVDGAAAARVGHLEAVKAACRGCHTQYEARYRAELSARPLP